MVAKCSGFRTILMGLIEGPLDLAEGLVSSLLYVLDRGETRVHLRPSIEFEVRDSVEVVVHGLRSLGHSVSFHRRFHYQRP
jgi:hypothetical protein